MLPYVTLAIAAIGALALVALRRRRFSELTLRATPETSGLGGAIAVELAVRARRPLDLGEVALSLVCEERVQARAGAAERTHVAFEDRRVVRGPGRLGPEDRVTASVSFRIPPSAMHTLRGGSAQVAWRLELTIGRTGAAPIRQGLTLDVLPLEVAAA